MARRIAKKVSVKSKKTAQVPDMPLSLSTASPEKTSGGGSFFKIFIIIILVLLALDGVHFLKNGFQFKKKYFVVKKIAQFTGTESLGKAISANGVVAVGPQELAVADNNGNQILLFDFNGKLIRKWGKRGDGPTDFMEPSGITTDRKGHIFVLDTWHGAIKGFDLNGKLFQTLDLIHFQSFYGPRKLTWASNCFIVADAANYRVVRLSLAGDLLSVWKGKGSGKGEFMGVSSSVADGKGNYYVCDGGINNRVQVFNEDGNVTRVIKTGVSPDGIALDSKNRLFVGSYGYPAKVFQTDGKYLGLLEDQDLPEQPIAAIQSIDITEDGVLVTCGGDTITLYQVVEQKEN